MRASGLRGRLNLILLPALAAALSGLMWIDYRHEVRVTMQAHMMHEAPVGNNVAPNPVPIETRSCLSSGGKVQRVISRRPDVTYAAFFTCPIS